MTSEKSMIFYVHIPKTAGTAIRQIISFYCPPERQGFLDGAFEQYSDFRAQALEDDIGDLFDVIHGHFPYGLHGCTKRHFKYFSIIRNPLERWHSDYFYSFRESSGLYQYNLELQPSLKLFSKNSPYWMDNIASKLIAGFHPTEELNISNSELLDLAIQRIENDFAFVGISEYLDESMLLISKLLGLPAPVTLIRNKQEHPRSEILSDEIIDAIRLKNAVDFKIYDFALKRFKMAIGDQCSLYWSALSELRHANEILRAQDKKSDLYKTFVAKEGDLPRFLLENHVNLDCVNDFISHDASLYVPTHVPQIAMKTQFLCKFCGANIDTHKFFATSCDYQLYRTLPCPSCFSSVFEHYKTYTVDPVYQAAYHETIFGISSENINAYNEDALKLRKLVSCDYSAYFGHNINELIVDVGAGRGSLLKALLDEGYSAIGCEFSEKLVAAGRSAYGLPNSVFFQLNAWGLPAYLKENSFKPSVLVFWHVIEHVQDSLTLIESLVKVCADQITLIFQTPLPVPEYVFPEHLFFPSTETYHFIAERLGLSVKLLYVVPFTRYVTCVLSNKDIPEGKIFPRQRDEPGFSVLGQLIAQLDSGLLELDQVTKLQYAEITQLEAQLPSNKCVFDKPLTLASDLSQIADFIQNTFGYNGLKGNLMHQTQKLANENKGLRHELLRAEAQLALMKDVLLKNHGEDSL